MPQGYQALAAASSALLRSQMALSRPRIGGCSAGSDVSSAGTLRCPSPRGRGLAIACMRSRCIWEAGSMRRGEQHLRCEAALRRRPYLWGTLRRGGTVRGLARRGLLRKGECSCRASRSFQLGTTFQCLRCRGYSQARSSCGVQLKHGSKALRNESNWAVALTIGLTWGRVHPLVLWQARSCSCSALAIPSDAAGIGEASATEHKN